MSAAWSDKILGEPEGTILAVPGLEALPGAWPILLSVAKELVLPVDWIATVICSESRWRPGFRWDTVLFGKPALFAAGLLPVCNPWLYDLELEELLTMPPEEQLVRLVLPRLRLALATHRPTSLGDLGMLLWCPALAGTAPDVVFGRADGDPREVARLRGWQTTMARLRGDSPTAPICTVGDVHAWYEAPAREAGGRRLSVPSPADERAEAEAS